MPDGMVGYAHRMAVDAKRGAHARAEAHVEEALGILSRAQTSFRDGRSVRVGFQAHRDADLRLEVRAQWDTDELW